MVAAGMIKKTFKGLKNENNIKRFKKRKQHRPPPPENSCIKKQIEDTSGQNAQQTNSEKKLSF